jgi:hypothetical protein
MECICQTPRFSDLGHKAALRLFRRKGVRSFDKGTMDACGVTSRIFGAKLVLSWTSSILVPGILHVPP